MAVRSVFGGRGRVGRGPASISPPAAAYSILTVTGVTLAIVTTAGPHDLSVGQLVRISGTSGAAYDGTGIQVDDVPSDTTFTTDLPYTADATGGRWGF